MATSDGSSSISVTVRVRPFTIREAAQLTKVNDGPLFVGDGCLASFPAAKLSQKGLRSIIKVVDDRCLVFDPPEDSPIHRFSRTVLPQGKRTKDQTFAFDKIFNDHTTQGDVYEATTKPLLDNVLDGYNATVFAYGATGCGKTHTITGTVQQPGIIFLTMQELFERISESQSERATEISISYLEIYNETIRDLLVQGGGKQGLMLREDASQAVSVAGLSSHNPQNVQEVMDLIVRGNECRTMSPTEANATSSRSHAVLQINVSSRDRSADVHEPHTVATLSIIDLAGSERASATKNRGERLIEGANINRSLLALGSCINALCDPRKRNHVPYRNSKLTRLLKFSLGGNCKTVMIVCVSPSSAHFDETQNTLRYANRAKNIQTKVTRNVFNVNRHVKDFLKKIDEQMTLIKELKAQQQEYEAVAFAKYRKLADRKEIVLNDGIQRLRSAFEHSLSERQDHGSNLGKLRQIERRIDSIRVWDDAFGNATEGDRDSCMPEVMLKARKSNKGILVELENSRNHLQGKVVGSTWHRHLETALSAGITQLRELENIAHTSDIANLERECELMKLTAERERAVAMLKCEKSGEGSLAHSLLQANFQAMSHIARLQSMTERDALMSGRELLGKALETLSNASNRVVHFDSCSASHGPVPPSQISTPRRKKPTNLRSPAQMMIRHPNAFPERVQSSPAKSPRKNILAGSRRGVVFTPRKRSPAKRAVRWRDDVNDGTLADYGKTPSPQSSSTPNPIRADLDTFMVLSDEATLAESNSTPPSAAASPSGALHAHSLSKTGRFQTGFLARKATASSPSASLIPSPALKELSPLRELQINQQARFEESKTPEGELDSTATNSSGSDSEGTWKTDHIQAQKISNAIRRSSFGRIGAARDAARVHRRRSPSGSGPTLSTETSLFTASHARRMVRIDRSMEQKPHVLSPATSPITRANVSASRRTTIDDIRSHQRIGSRDHSGMTNGQNNGRPSIQVAGKSVWR